MPSNAEVAAAPAVSHPLPLYFTRAEKIALCGRLLLGAAFFNVLGVALLIAINVAGSYGTKGNLLLEEAFLFTWSRWYNLKTDDGPMVALYTFHWYLNGLCLRHLNGTDCLYRSPANSFDGKSIEDSMNSYLRVKMHGGLEEESEQTLPDNYTFDLVKFSFAMFVIGILSAVGSWAVLFSSDRIENDKKSRFWGWSVATQGLAALCYLVGAGTLSDGIRKMSDVFKGPYSYTHNDFGVCQYASGWSFFAAAYVAFVAQLVAFIAQCIWIEVWKSKDKVEPWATSSSCPPNFETSGQEGDDELPGYTRHDPMGRPPSIGGGGRTGRREGHNSDYPGAEVVELREIGGDRVSREEGELRSRSADDAHAGSHGSNGSNGSNAEPVAQANTS